MSVRRLAAEQPEGFAFTPENLEWAKGQIKKYPQGREASAVLALLWRAQEQMGGWLPEPALRYVADMLGLAYIRVYEIATFYTMFNLAPVGRYYVQVCGTTPCWLLGANAIKDTCRRVIGEAGHVTPDGMFSWIEVECLGACVNAPVAQINKYYYEDLTPESLERLLGDLKAGKPVTPGPQNGRHASAPEGGPMTLLDSVLYANEEPEEELVGAGAVLTDREAKRPGKAANVREAAVPKPPLSKGRKPR
ncbi:MAG: NADH-quinone oxidoreductase subunit NuoE [Methyloceanibacter sp.]|uniref:NADH-quinone oxidoreductase subunit NuoE n=1 Tax=Methyloceanibacter sp. TaxID=1965321 RepID=UPI003D9AF846